jgi:hypothetical protein
MDRTTRILSTFQSLFAATLLAAPLMAESAIPAERYRAIREVRIKAPSRPKLSRVLDRIVKSRKQVDEDVQTRKVSAEEGRKLRKNLSAIADKTFALALKGRDLPEARVETLVWELDQVRRLPSPKKSRQEEHRVLAAASRRGSCSADDESYDCLKTRDAAALPTNDLISRR